MRRQTKPQGLVDRWVKHPFEIDPFSLPACFSLRANNLAGHLCHAKDIVTIDSETVIVQPEYCGIRMRPNSFQLSEFRGIAVRITPCEKLENEFAISVNLHHDRKRLCLPLYMTFDFGNVAARWQAWGRVLKLPLLLPTLDGNWREAVERLGKVTIGQPCPRNARLLLAARRPIFPFFRETGHSDNLQVINGREIIARS